MPATGLLNEAMQDLKATLTAVTGLRVVSDPTKIVPNCVFLDAPSFETIAGGGNIVRVTIQYVLLAVAPQPKMSSKTSSALWLQSLAQALSSWQGSRHR